MTHATEVDLVKPITQSRFNRSALGCKLRPDDDQFDDDTHDLPIKKENKREKQRKLDRSPVGKICRQNRSAARDLSPGYSYTSPQLPSINKIERNAEVFKSFVDTSRSVLVSTELPKKSVKAIGKTYKRCSKSSRISKVLDS